ncbi:acylphosphatase [Fundicoccus sp. Sow4_D5]|uniref:acylphosphatase n=1 Tax=unclassified Fundicoccus TaxID=2761543 RepID=UPI003F93745E
MKTYQIIVNGRVQGVGYRAHIHNLASSKKLKGNVRNLSDGSVKIILQGDDLDLDTMDKIIYKKAHPFMNVTESKVEERPNTKTYKDFKIVY